MAESDKTMFEIYRETGYNHGFRYVFYTELGEHGRDVEIARAAAGETLLSGFVADAVRDQARARVAEIVDELNELGEDEAPPPPERIRDRLRPFLLP